MKLLLAEPQRSTDIGYSVLSWNIPGAVQQPLGTTTRAQYGLFLSAKGGRCMDLVVMDKIVLITITVV